MKLTIVDPYVTVQSPSMRGIVASLDVLTDAFSEIEVWATECDWVHPKVRVNQVPQRFKPWTLHALDYNRYVNSRQIGRQSQKDELVQVTGCLVPLADIRFIHFWNRALLEEAEKRPALSMPLLKRLPTQWAARTEGRVAADSTSTGEWWVVSRALAGRISQDTGAAGKFKILPNQYNPQRFNPEVRVAWRDAYREHYGFAATDKVFAFSAFGHFERKGLLQAAEAMDLMAKRGGEAKLLVLGGTEATIQAFRGQLKQHGIGDASLVFAGMVDEIERHLAAADALLFPSHFEAFSLAEIEAAAMGLRLYLTPHYGSEMIMREPSNGRMLPWGAVGMADVLESELRSGAVGTFHGELGEALNPHQYRDRLAELYRAAIERKTAVVK